jgi:prepilin-type N-terminal cleavage/methylation domain-containing protein
MISSPRSEEVDMRTFPRSDNKGFSLIEMAFVLIIAGIVISMGVELLPMLVRQHKFTDASNRVQEAKTALIGYALANGRLPRAGNINGNETAAYRGYIPYAVLGIKGTDPYNDPSPIYYAVDQNLTTTTTVPAFKTRLQDIISTSTLPSPLLHCNGSLDAAVVVFSAGPNRTVDAPNSVTGTGNFETPGGPQTATYDDILDAVSLTYLLGRLP